MTEEKEKKIKEEKIEECKCNDKKDNKDNKEHHKCECHNKKEHKKDKCECKNKKTDELEKEKEQLLKQVSDLTEKIKLTQAELINYRKRKDEEVSNFKKFCNQDIITELIPIIDNFERAISLDDNDLTDELSKFLAGFKMMYASLMEVLKKFGVEEISRQGEIFDANLEEALMTDNLDEYEEDAVTEVLLKGYKLNGRVIRPASVKINKKD